jgi:hypothetical protein
VREGSELAFELLLASGASLGEIRIRESNVQLPEGTVLHGLDTKGRRHLLVPLLPDQHVIEDRRSAGVQLHLRELLDAGSQKRYLDVVCLLPHLNSLFSTVADEMLERIAEAPAKAPQQCELVLNRWRELLERPSSSLLGPERVAALIAELSWVERIARHDPHRALVAWRGPLRERYDFMGSLCSLEVKSTIAREGRHVEIHGDRQLDDPPEGPLYLAFHRLERVEDGGTTIPERIVALQALAVDHLRLLQLLLMAGYDSRDGDSYARLRFNESEFRVYMVNDGFPRVIPASFVGRSVPARVLSLRYTIDLEGEPPTPIPHAEVESVVAGLMTQ